MIASPYQDLFPYINDAVFENWIAEWTEKDDKLKEILSDTQSWKENKRCRMDETVINRIRAAHTPLIHGYLMEGLPMPECELCHSHAMTVKHVLTVCANKVIWRLRFFDGSNPKTLKKVRGRNKINSNTIKFLKESNIFNRA